VTDQQQSIEVLVTCPDCPWPIHLTARLVPAIDGPPADPFWRTVPSVPRQDVELALQAHAAQHVDSRPDEGGS
jgi:hypothetical protein